MENKIKDKNFSDWVQAYSRVVLCLAEARYQCSLQREFQYLHRAVGHSTPCSQLSPPMEEHYAISFPDIPIPTPSRSHPVPKFLGGCRETLPFTVSTIQCHRVERIRGISFCNKISEFPT